jgi:hypothetical protein
MQLIRSFVFTVVVAACAAPAAFAQQDCRPVTGHFEATVIPPPACEALLCTAGRVWGGLQGTYAFVMTTQQPTDPETPTIFFFTGKSTIAVKGGGQVSGTDTGAIDVGAGGFASLITFTGGTGQYAGATGQIRLRGDFDPEAGITTGDYTGQICR